MAASKPEIQIRQIRSAIGFNQKQKDTLRALGLGKVGRVRTISDNDAVRGMVARIPHLVEVVQDEA